MNIWEQIFYIDYLTKDKNGKSVNYRYQLTNGQGLGKAINMLLELNKGDVVIEKIFFTNKKGNKTTYL